MIENEGNALLAIYCDFYNGVIGRFGGPAEILIAEDASEVIVERAVKEALGILKKTAESTRAYSIELLLNESLLRYRLVLGLSLSANYSVTPHLRAVLDLQKSTQERKSQFRKGHRQQVKWGAKELELGFVDEAHPDQKLFGEYKELHQSVAGRATRSIESWQMMFDYIKNGYGELIVAYFEKQLVGGTLILDSETTAFYASGAYVRSHFDKPLSHYPIATSFERARIRGRSAFDIGEVPVDATCSAKERSIGDFKRGFTSTIRLGLRCKTSTPVGRPAAPTYSSQT